MSKINVLQIISTLDIGGVEIQLVELVKRLNREKYNITVCCITRGGHLEGSIRNSGVKLIILKRRFKFDPSIIFQIIRLIKKEKIDLVHTYMFTANTWGRIAAILAGISVIVAAQRDIDLWKKWYHILIDRFLTKYTDVIIANSRTTKDFTSEQEGISPDKFAVIYNGVNLNTFNPELFSNKRGKLGLDEKTPVVGVVARLDHPKKGHEYLFQAAVQIKEHLPRTRFLVIGDGPSMEMLMGMVKNMGLTDDIIFMGERNDIPDMLLVMNVFVLPSLWEGLGNVLIEAMAMASKPVVATDVGGIPEVVDDGKTGILVSPKNPQALAEGIIRLLKNKEEAGRMGLAGRRRVEQYFDIKQAVEKVENLYDELIK